MNINICFSKSFTVLEKKALLRVVSKAKSEKDIAQYTREHGIWMLINPSSKTLVFFK